MIFSKRKTIGVFIDKQFKAFDDVFLAAVDRESRRLDYDVVVFTAAGYYLTKSDYDIQEKNILQFVPLGMLDGIIAVPSTYEKGEFRDLLYEMLEKRATCPKVIVREESDIFHCVFTDNNKAVRMLVRHLIEDHGLKKICCQAGDFDNPEVQERLNAVREEMAAHGLTLPDEKICLGNMWTTCGDIAYNAFFSDPDDVPEAVVCANDYMAMGLMRILREKGYRVPEDVIVTGFDNVTEWCIDVPGLSTIKPDFDGMVVEAMRLLDQSIRGNSEPDRPVKIGLKGELILRESCGCGKRDVDFFKNLAEKSMRLLEEANDQDANMNNMSIDLGACNELSELHEVLISKRTESRIVRDIYVCLFGTPEKLMDESSPKACVVHAFRDHKDHGMPMTVFDRDHLLPLMAEREEEPQMFYLKLLHQNRHNFGYSMIRYDAGKVPSRCFVQANVLLCIAFENIYRRKELLALYEERRLSSITDLLTGLLNRRGLMEQVEPLWRELIGKEIAFVCIDLDKLKTINDTYGHTVGDFAISLVGRAIRNTLPLRAVGSRVGGDEFLVFLPEAENRAAEKYVALFKKELTELNKKEGRTFVVSASAGYAAMKPDGKITIEECMQASDRELYKVKAAREGS